MLSLEQKGGFMNELKIGDIVYLNSEKDVTMTVTYINTRENKVQCVYYNTSTQEFKYCPAIPIEAVTKVM